MLLASAAGLAHGQGGPPPALVKVDLARMEEVAQWREVTGELRSPKRSLLAAEQAGLVLSLAVDAGDEVKQGAVIAELDSTLARIEVERERANVAAREGEVAESRSQVEKATRDLARIEELSTQASASRTELDDAKTTLALTNARLVRQEAEFASAQAELRLAEARLAKLVIHAPFDGRIVSKRAEVGQWVREGDSLVEVVALRTLEARLQVPEGFVASAGVGATVRVRVRAAGYEADATVTGVIPEADPLSRLFPVRAMIDNADERLKPGMSVQGLVRAGGAEPSLTIHKDGILRDDAGEFVYFVAGPVAAPARVRTLFAVPGDRVAIAPGSLPPGAQVIIEGNERLFPGQPVRTGDGPPPGGPPGGPPGTSSGEPPAGASAAETK